jgi:hypothetical protein
MRLMHGHESTAQVRVPVREHVPIAMSLMRSNFLHKRHHRRQVGNGVVVGDAVPRRHCRPARLFGGALSTPDSNDCNCSDW